MRIAAKKKEKKVCQGTAHAALVYHAATCVGWCQVGPPEELPCIKHLRIYAEGSAAPPQWRITCFFVDKAYPCPRGRAGARSMAAPARVRSLLPRKPKVRA